jgi:hypothetical protein
MTCDVKNFVDIERCWWYIIENQMKEVDMKKEFWEVNKEEPVIYPQDLIDNPNNYGGLGVHMKLSIERGIVTVPLIKNSVYVSIPVSQSDSERIVKDGGVDIHSKGYWCSILSVNVMFKNTEEKITLLRGLF